MKAQLVEADLMQIEREYGVHLGRSIAPTEDQDQAYYPQFDEAVRHEAAEMAEHYELFHCLEKTIRGLISESLEEQDGAGWWDKGRVPKAIHEEVGKRMQRDLDSGVTLRSTRAIDFTTFGELAQLITANWDLFGAILNSQRAVEKVMSNLNTLRGPIAHCSSLAPDEVLRLQLSLRDWFRLME